VVVNAGLTVVLNLHTGIYHTFMYNTVVLNIKIKFNICARFQLTRQLLHKKHGSQTSVKILISSYSVIWKIVELYIQIEIGFKLTPVRAQFTLYPL